MLGIPWPDTNNIRKIKLPKAFYFSFIISGIPETQSVVNACPQNSLRIASLILVFHPLFSHNDRGGMTKHCFLVSLKTKKQHAIPSLVCCNPSFNTEQPVRDYVKKHDRDILHRDILHLVTNALHL